MSADDEKNDKEAVSEESRTTAASKRECQESTEPSNKGENEYEIL